jgi:hydroxymethylbilane synthase
MILGTRGSALALAQANNVSALLKELEFVTEINIIKTSGDSFTDRPLHQIPGMGAFVREIDDRMLSGEIDIAVHSMKDIPTERPPELINAAVLKRDSPFDVLMTRDGSTVDELPEGAVIGTTSMRRRSQFLRYRPAGRSRTSANGLGDGCAAAEPGPFLSLRQPGYSCGGYP